MIGPSRFLELFNEQQPAHLGFLSHGDSKSRLEHHVRLLQGFGAIDSTSEDISKSVNLAVNLNKLD